MLFHKSVSARAISAGAISLSLLYVLALPTNPALCDEVSITNRPPVGLVLLDLLMSGRSQLGDIVHFETVATVYDKDKNILIPAGCLAVGHVTRSTGSGMFGKRGQIAFTCEYVILPNGDHVPLTGSQLGGSGDNATATTAAVSVLVSPLGLLIKGGTAKYVRGTAIVMYVADGAKFSTGVTGSPVSADFTLSKKNTSDITGEVVDFDGDNYTIKTGDGQQIINLKEISTISIPTSPISGPIGQ